MNIKCQGHSMIFVQGHSDSTFSKFFAQKPLGRLKPNFIWSLHGMWEMKICSPYPYMVKIFKNLLRNQEADDLETWYTASGYTRVHQCFHMMTLGWPWPFLWQGQICFWMLLHGWKLIQHWVLMYFQVCSNSAYPQQSALRWVIQDQWSSGFILKIYFVNIYRKFPKYSDTQKICCNH